MNTQPPPTAMILPPIIWLMAFERPAAEVGTLDDASLQGQRTPHHVKLNFVFTAPAGELSRV